MKRQVIRAAFVGRWATVVAYASDPLAAINRAYEKVLRLPREVRGRLVVRRVK